MGREDHTAVGPTFSVGPMDVDSAAGLTARLGTHNKAGALLRRHAQSFPAALMRILQLPKDEVATRVVKDHLDAVRDAALSARGRHQFLKSDDEVLNGAAVREDEVTGERFVTIIYRKPSGRIARGAIGFDSVTGLDAAVEEAKAREEAKQSGGAGAPLHIATSASAGDPQAAEAAREAANNLQELEDRLAALEDPEPFEGYGEMDARALATHLKAEGLDLYGRVGLQRVIAYEESHKDRSTVSEAAKDVLAAADAASQ
jgi:hypothetical protein